MYLLYHNGVIEIHEPVHDQQPFLACLIWTGTVNNLCRLMLNVGSDNTEAGNGDGRCVKSYIMGSS